MAKKYNRDAIMKRVQAARPHLVKQKLHEKEQEVDTHKKLHQATKAELRAVKKEAQLHKQKLQEIEDKKQQAIEKRKKTLRKKKKNA